MGLSEGIDRITRAGFVLCIQDDALMVEPFSKLTEGQLAWLRSHKAEILDTLRQTGRVMEASALSLWSSAKNPRNAGGGWVFKGGVQIGCRRIGIFNRSNTMANRNPVPDEEVFKSIAARIVLADEHLLAATLIMASLKRVLPAPRAQNLGAARCDLKSSLERHAALEAVQNDLSELRAG